MGDERGFTINSFVLDVYVEHPLDGGDAMAALRKHFAPVEPDEASLSPFPSEQESVVMAAKDPDSFLDDLESSSTYSEGFRHTRRYFRCAEARLRILREKEWPFEVVHLSFILQVPGEEESKQDDIHGLVLATAQDLYYALIYAFRDDLGDLSSAAITTMVVDVPSTRFAEIRGAWESAARASPEKREQERPQSLWEILGPDWHFGDIGSMSHMALGINVHGVVGPLHATATPVRQVFSVTFQDVEMQSYHSRDVRHDFNLRWWGPMELLSPLRGAYYRPRSFELGMLLLFDQWTHRRLDGLRALQNAVLDAIARARPTLRARDVLMSRKEHDGRVMELRRQVLAEEADFQRALTVGGGPISSLLSDASIYGGVEVPAYRYPTASFGQQHSTQGGFIFGLAERTATRLRSLKETTRELVGIASEDVALQVSESQAVLTRWMAWLTVVIAALTAALVARELLG